MHYKYCIRCTFSRAEAKLHIIYLNSISHSCFYHSFKNFHCMLQQFYPSIRSTFHCITFALVYTIIQLLHQSAGTLPSLTTALNRSVIHSTTISPAAFSISVTTPDGPDAFPDFMSIMYDYILNQRKTFST